MSKDNVVTFPGVNRIIEELGAVEVDTVFEDAYKANLAGAIIVGFDKLGKLHVFSTESNYYQTIGKLICAANWLAGGTPVASEEDDETNN